MNVIFEEKQQFRQWWLWLIMLITAGVIISMPFQNISSISPLAYGISIVFIVLFILFFLLVKLESRVDDKGISFKFFPLERKEYLWSEIERAKIVNYGVIGGLGVRMGTKYGTVYNVKGQIGLHIKLKTGKEFVVGTQKHNELNQVLKALKSIN